MAIKYMFRKVFEKARSHMFFLKLSDTSNAAGIVEKEQHLNFSPIE